MSSGVVHDGCEVPETLSLRREGAVGIITLSRPAKRNALSDRTILGLERIFTNLAPEVRAIVLDAEGDHFCAGLDLAEMAERDTLAGVAHSRMWHRAFDTIEDSLVPVVSVLSLLPVVPVVVTELIVSSSSPGVVPGHASPTAPAPATSTRRS